MSGDSTFLGYKYVYICRYRKKILFTEHLHTTAFAWLVRLFHLHF